MRSSKAVALWTKVAIDWFTWELGRDSAQVRKMRKYLKKPSTHPAWASRRAMAVE